MKFLSLLPLLAVLISTAQAVEQPSAHTKGTPTGTLTGPLKPGEYWWRPQLSPSGPLIVLIAPVEPLTGFSCGKLDLRIKRTGGAQVRSASQFDAFMLFLLRRRI
jgi:hypothetical protein